jgi:hypothetical protein
VYLSVYDVRETQSHGLGQTLSVRAGITDTLCTCVSEEGDDGEGVGSEAPSLLS